MDLFRHIQKGKFGNNPKLKKEAKHELDELGGKKVAEAHEKKVEMAKKMKKESSFGLPHGEKETPQLRRRFKNYLAKQKKEYSPHDWKREEHLLKQNNFYEFNKPEYD